MHCLLFVPRLTFPQASTQGWSDKRRETGRVSFTQSRVPACAPIEASSTHSSQLCGGLGIILCTFLVLLIFPACSMSQWNFEKEIWLGVLCPSPLQAHWHPPHLVTKIPFTQLPSTESACWLNTTLRSGQDK